MKRMAINLIDGVDGSLLGKRYLIMDRDTKFSDAFRKILADEGIGSVRLPPRSPNLNPHIERLMKSLKGEALESMIFFGEKMLHTAVGQFLEHYHFDPTPKKRQRLASASPGHTTSCEIDQAPRKQPSS